MIQVSVPSELQLIVEKLAEYNFTDSLGHPLVNCEDFHDLVRLCCSVRFGTKAAEIESISNH